MKGLLGGLVIAVWFAYIVNISLVSKYVGYKSIQQLKDILSILFVTGCSAMISYSIVTPLGLNMYFDGITKAIVLVVLYLGWSLVFKPEAYTYSLSIIKTQLKK